MTLLNLWRHCAEAANSWLLTADLNVGRMHMERKKNGIVAFTHSESTAFVRLVGFLLMQGAHSAAHRDDSNVTAQFTPRLCAYVTSDYQETKILRGKIQTPMLWEMDLAKLSETTTWNLTWDANTGHYTITKA
ncbi:hypothetical protein BDR03DRAFT_1033421 [Suillus americanus]|nr:hypothetical protein BDR03DRAFT_1033421 [Suillus americanus]